MFKKLFSSGGSWSGCGGGCGNPKPDDIIEPKPKARSDQTHSNQFLTSTTTTTTTTTTSSETNTTGNRAVVYRDVHAINDDSSFTINNTEKSPLLLSDTDRECDPTSPVGAKLGDSVAVEKYSDDPYRDFQQSMLQMIRENRIYSNDDLQELLECFLRLNSSSHHDMIIQAFTEIWNFLVIQTSPT